MRGRSTTRIAVCLWGLAVLFKVGAHVMVLLPASFGPLTIATALGTFAAALVGPTVGALVAVRRPANPVGWLLLGASVVGHFTSWCYAYSLYPDPAAAHTEGGFLPGQYYVMSTALALSGFLQTVGPFIFLLFPNGGLPSPRWRPVAGVTLATYLFLNLVVATKTEGPLYGPFQPFELSAAEYYGGTSTFFGTLILFAFWLAVALLVVSVASLFVRLRRARGDERHQLKWAALAAAFLTVNSVALTVLRSAMDEHPAFAWFVNSLALPLSGAAFPLCIGVAVLKYRLYDIDIILNKAVVYGSLAALITAVYVGIAVAIGGVVGAGDDPNLALSILATAVVAIGFQPARERLQRLANRLVYGQRATPYEVMGDFARRMADAMSAEDVLPRMAEAAARGVGAERSRVRLVLLGGQERSVAWPEGSCGDGFDRTVTAVHGAERVGEISVAKPAGDRLSPAEEQLLDDLASQAGLAMRNAGLMAQLLDSLAEISAQASELEASRRRIVTAQDEERRRLERDLHDGAQQHLVSLAGQLRLLQRVMVRSPEQSERLLQELISDADEALEAVRDLGRGIFPPILADKGLASALTARVTKHFPSGKLEWPPEFESVRFDPEVEAAVYFCCLEALQNVGRHAGDVPVTINVSGGDNSLVFAVSDSGPGFDVSSCSTGRGLQNMADRLAALGGTFEIRSEVGIGTRVSGELPLDSSAAYAGRDAAAAHSSLSPVGSDSA